LHRKRYLVSLVLVVAIAAVSAAFAFGSTSGKGVTVVAKDNGVKMEPNKYIQDNMGFDPGTVTIKSGDTLTFKFSDKKSMEPHTITIVKQSDLPTNGQQVENCKACQRLASGHLKSPKAPPDQHNPIVHWTLNQGKPGFDTVGDSIAIQEPGMHKSNAVKVTAAAGTTLYFLCAVHPWMQGKIVVK